MSAQNPTQLKLVDSPDGQTKDGPKTLQKILDGLKSKEIVISFSGPLGSGLKDVSTVLTGKLKELDYEVVPIKLSSLIAKHAILANEQDRPSLSTLKGADRYDRLQSLGNELRQKRGPDILAQLAVREISVDRAARTKEKVKDIVPGRVAYILDQLKNPSEVKLLRAVYQDNFFLIGILRGYAHRKKSLRDEGLKAEEAEGLMERDRQERQDSGQQMEKTLLHADFFIRNEKSNTTQLTAPIERFLHLIHGANGITPTTHEQGMYAAYAAALGSACLSRQVGAAILDTSSEVIATGCNDVPRGGGGLYREGDEALDFRCVHLQGGICFNDKKKDDLTNEIKAIVQKSLEQKLQGKLSAGIDLSQTISDVCSDVGRKIRADTRLKDLIEFSRSVHAEMDALVSLTRTGRGSAQDGVLYTTTYPCHNCARHIVAAGIRSVYFIDPYDKSLAAELHEDAIEHDADEDMALSEWADVDRKKQRKVRFLHFEGVAPCRFLDLFAAGDGRKKNGKAPTWSGREASKKVPEYLEGYPDLEARVVEHLVTIGMEKAPDTSPQKPPSSA